MTKEIIGRRKNVTAPIFSPSFHLAPPSFDQKQKKHPSFFFLLSFEAFHASTWNVGRGMTIDLQRGLGQDFSCIKPRKQTKPLPGSSFSLSHTHTQSHSHMYSVSFSRVLRFSLSFFHAHTLSLSLFLTHSRNLQFKEISGDPFKDSFKIPFPEMGKNKPWNCHNEMAYFHVVALSLKHTHSRSLSLSLFVFGAIYS